jgi:hypothetical protein
MARAKLSGALLAQKSMGAPTATQNDIERQGALPAKLSEGQGSKPIALTVKVDQAHYEALKVLGARTRRSNQEILLAALDAYLYRVQFENRGPAGGR